MRKHTHNASSIWENISAKRVLLCLLWGTLMLSCAMAMTVLEGRYPRGFAMVFFAVFAVLLVRSLKRLMTDRLQAAIAQTLGRFFSVLFSPVARAAKAVSVWLGIGRWKGWCEDEKTFVGWRERQTSRRRRRIKNDQKWSDQTSNREKVRFLYIEYMVKRIRGGFIYRHQLTPSEIANEQATEDRLLFDAYNVARYANDASIADEVVEQLHGIAQKK